MDDCMSPEYHIEKVSGNFEKLNFTLLNKFGPEVIILWTVLPLASIHKDQIGNVSNLNNKIQQFAKIYF